MGMLLLDQENGINKLRYDVLMTLWIPRAGPGAALARGVCRISLGNVCF